MNAFSYSPASSISTSSLQSGISLNRHARFGNLLKSTLLAHDASVAFGCFRHVVNAEAALLPASASVDLSSVHALNMTAASAGCDALCVASFAAAASMNWQNGCTKLRMKINSEKRSLK
jgi:hypothetical protein